MAYDLTPTLRRTPTHYTLRLVRLATNDALSAAHSRHPDRFRLLTLIALHVGGDLEAVAGWGECSALNHAGYTDESADGAFELLRTGIAFDRQRFPMAAAALDMAALDAHLRDADQSLGDRVGTSGSSAVAGAVVGLGPLRDVLDQIESITDHGYRRVKCKIAPGRISAVPRAIRASFPEIELQADANASLSAEDFDEVLALADLGLTAIEQPFGAADLATAARLVATDRIQVIADEAVTSLGDVARLADAGAASAIAIKPPKLGGIAAALEVVDAAMRAGLGASLGGMLECGLGRHALAALAPLAAFTIVGDLSPARRWLAEDPFADITMRRGHIAVPKRPGIAGDPDRGVLDRCTVRTAVVAIGPGHGRQTATTADQPS